MLHYRYVLLRPSDVNSITQTPRGRFWSAATVPPALVIAPSITDPGEFGLPLVVVPGTWTGTSPTFTYQWLRDGVPIAGATGTSYTRNWHFDDGATITVRETATNAGGSVFANSSNSVTVSTDALVGAYAWTYSWDLSDLATTDIPPQDGGLTLTGLGGLARTLGQITAPLAEQAIGLGGDREDGAVLLEAEHWEVSDAGLGTTDAIHLRLIAQRRDTGSQTTWIDYGGLQIGNGATAGEYFITVPGQAPQTFSGNEVDGEWVVLDVFLADDGASGTTARLMVNEVENDADLGVIYAGVGQDLAVGGTFGGGDIDDFTLLFVGIRHDVSFDFTQHNLDYVASGIVPVAPSNIAPPIVTGTVEIGETLTTTNGSWSAYPAPTFTYQWERDTIAIAGATSSTYDLVEADYAANIRCTVTATNVAGALAASSNSVGPVPGIVPSNDVAPDTTGTHQVGETLTVVPGTWSGVPAPTLTYQWLRDGVPIVGETSTTYDLVAADYNTIVRCRETATNIEGSAFELTPDYGAVAGTVPVNLVAPVLSGTPEVGEDLTVSNGTWDGVPTPTFTYEFFQDSPRTSVQGPGASNTYSVQEADIGFNIEADVIALNAAGTDTATSNALGPVAGVAPVFASPPTIAIQAPDQGAPGPSAGEADPSDTVEVTDTGLSGVAVPTPTLSYDWRRDGISLGAPDQATYTFVEADFDADIDVIITATNIEGVAVSDPSNAIGPVVGEAPTNLTLPIITTDGIPNVGDIISVSNGTWAAVPDPSSYTYQWRRDTTPIGGATANTYTLAMADYTANIDCVVTAINTEGTGDATAVAVGPVAGQPPINDVLPVITTDGTPAVGETISVSDGTWTATPAPTYTYQWRRDTTPIGGATSNTYDLVPADYTTNIDCIVTATNIEGSTPATAVAVGPIAGNAPNFAASPTIALQAPDVGVAGASTDDTLEVTATGLDGLAAPSATLSYDWRRNGATIGAPDQATYDLVAADYGTNITVVITATNIIGADVSDPSNAIGPIAGEVPVNLTLPVITTDGTPQAFETISVSDGTWSGVPTPTFTYQWRRDASGTPTPISGATSNTYTLESADYNLDVDCIVTATNAEGATDATAVAIGPVAGVAPTNDVLPVITTDGTPAIGETISVSDGSWTAAPDPAYTYQWRREISFTGNPTWEADPNNTATVDVGDGTPQKTAGVQSWTDGIAYSTSEPLLDGASGTLRFFVDGPGGATAATKTAVRVGLTDDPGGTNDFVYAWELVNQSGNDPFGRYLHPNGDTLNDPFFWTSSTELWLEVDEGAGLVRWRVGGGGSVVHTEPLVHSGTLYPIFSAETVDSEVTSNDWTSSSAVAIAGATANTYTLQNLDYQADIDCVVTATNAIGNDDATAVAVGPIAGLAPSFATPPVIAVQAPDQGLAGPSIGDANPSDTIEVTDTGLAGTGFPTPTLTYDWRRDGISIGAPDQPTYQVQAADYQTDIDVEIDAINAVGSDTSNSNDLTVNGEVPANVTAPQMAATNIHNVGKTLTVDDEGTWTGFPDPTV